MSQSPVPEQADAPEGARVRVTGVNGAILVVQPK